MPRGNPVVWKEYGASYSELAGTKTSAERAVDLAPRRLPPVAPSDLAASRSMRAAGAPAGTLPRGAGTFALQTTWSLTAPAAALGGAATRTGSGRETATAAGRGSANGAAGAVASGSGAAGGASGSGPRCGAGGRGGAALYPATSAHVADPGAVPRSYATETRVNFGPPPAGYRRTRSAGPVLSEMPRPDHPNDWCTLKQLDYAPDALARCQRPPPCRHPDSGRLLPADVPPGAPAPVSTHRAAHGWRSAAAAAGRALPAGGARATQAPGYNIITGAPALGNNAFEAWDGRDYRRHR